jgi:hypothetical protein
MENFEGLLGRVAVTVLRQTLSKETTIELIVGASGHPLLPFR